MSSIPVTISHCSVGPIGPTTKRCYCGCVPIYVSIYLPIYLSMFLCLVVGFRPRFHSGHLAPSEFSCSKRQTTLTTLNIRSDPKATWEYAKSPNFSASVTHAHWILGRSRKTQDTIANSFSSIETMYICTTVVC